jgi:hypothetical protein
MIIEPCPEVTSPWWNWYPYVGTFIGVLAGLGVLVPWFRGSDIGKGEKAFWSVVMVGLVILELRSITLDGHQHIRDQAHAECVQLQSFRDIAGTLNDTLSKTNQNLVTANQILKAANQTLFQTQPRAFFGPASHNKNEPNRILEIGKSYRFNVNLPNSGNDVANNTVVFARTYVANPFDSSTDSDIVQRFESDWKEAKLEGKTWPVGKVQPGDASPYVSFDSQILSKDDFLDLAAARKTIYTVIRISYTDRTGSWYSDTCTFLQLPINKDSVTPDHVCQFLGDSRYKPKRH